MRLKDRMAHLIIGRERVKERMKKGCDNEMNMINIGKSKRRW